MTTDKPQELHDLIDRLARKLLSLRDATHPEQRVLVGISGIPGAGKSTISKAVVHHANALYALKTGTKCTDFAIDVPMDGYHYTRAHLATMPDPEIATHRRGAAFTYDSVGFLDLVKRLRDPVDVSSTGVFAPSFDHATKDPVEGAIEILPRTRIVVLEGNYISLNVEPWESAAKLMDERWLVTVDRAIARERLAKRHVSSGIVTDIEAAYRRIDSTDSLNADEILTKCMEVDEVLVC